MALTTSLLLLFVALFFSNRVDIQTTQEHEQVSPEAKKPEDLIENILVLGSDSVIPKKLTDWKGRSDMLLLMSVHKIDKTLTIVSIPRDTKVNLGKHGITKINAANAISGYKLARKAVNRLLGTKVDHVAVFSMGGFEELIDAFGDFDINVSKKLSYHDNTANLHIEIEPGWQSMDGKTLMRYLRFRSDEMGDIGRIKRQQKFFKSAMRKLYDPKTVLRLPEIFIKANQVFITDMKFSEMYNLVRFLKTIPRKNINSYILPGYFGKGKYDTYWIADKQGLKKISKEINKGLDKT